MVWIICKILGSLASTTLIIKSASLTSCKVALNDSIKLWGRLETKPTVSDIIKLSLLSRSILLTCVSRVAKSMSLVKTCFLSALLEYSFKRLFKVVDLPEFVYPTNATCGKKELFR